MISCGVGILPDGGGLRASDEGISARNLRRGPVERTPNMHESVRAAGQGFCFDGWCGTGYEGGFDRFVEELSRLDG